MSQGPRTPRPPGSTPAPLSRSRTAARLARDFYRTLIRDSQQPRAGFLSERERWLRSVQVDGREELLFEFEMLLRAVERGFNLNNLAFDPERPPVVTRDFREELLDVRDALDGVIRIARALLDPDTDQKFVFRRYVESRLVDERERRRLLEDELDQDTPEESLFILRQSFDALRVVADSLLELPLIPFATFQSIGDLALREIFLNQYFRPFRPLEFRIEYDRLNSVQVLEALQTESGVDRALLTSGFLALFRLLRYLEYASASGVTVRRARVILALVRSDAHALIGFLKEEVSASLTKKRQKAAALRIARDIAREGERIFKGQVAGRPVTEAVEAFTELFRAQIVALAAALEPALSGCEFEEIQAPIDRAQRLRKDLWVLSALCRQVDARLRGEDSSAATHGLEALRAYLEFFQDVSYQLLRYADFDAFDPLLLLVLEAPTLAGPAQRARLADDVRQLGRLAEATFTTVSRRAHLKASTFNRADAEALLARFAQH